MLGPQKAAMTLRQIAIFLALALPVQAFQPPSSFGSPALFQRLAAGGGKTSPLQLFPASVPRTSASRLTPQMSGFGFGKTTTKKKDDGAQQPSVLSPRRVVPPEIARPDYADDGNPKARAPAMPWNIYCNTPEEIECIRKAARAAREVLDLAGQALKPGVTTDAIDELVHTETVKRGGYPSPLNYCGFPKSVCTSINEVVCHGIPCTKTTFKNGDIVNIDVTVFLDGYHGDCSETYCVGEVDEAGKKLVKVTYDAWQAAIKICKPGVQYCEIGGVIDEIAQANGYTSTRNFCGHGVGKVFHTNPTILHYKNKQNNGEMAPGHIFTIEPMINEGVAQNVMWKDNWTAVTRDMKRSAQFEHTLLITSDGVEALTAKTETSPKYFWEEE